MATISTLHEELGENPYSVPIRLRLIQAYEASNYPDLAAAECYRSILLIDEIVDDSGEFHEEAFESAAYYYARRKELGDEISDQVDQSSNEEDVQIYAKEVWLRTLYHALVQNLLKIDCLKSAYEYCLRSLKTFPDEPSLKEDLSYLIEKLRAYFLSEGEFFDPSNIQLDDVPDRGFARRELYQWNQHEPDRFGDTALTTLNEQMNAVAPKLEVRVTELPVLEHERSATDAEARPTTVRQLGVFAKEPIDPNTIILDEKSLLTAHGRLHDTFCDACSAPLSRDEGSAEYVQCPECDDVTFCSEDCLDRAQDSYHPAMCGTDVEVSAADATAIESSDALYSLLLLRTLAMSETQDIHPLDLPEVQYIWGDYTNLGRATQNQNTAPRTLPFSFKYNVFLPLHMLEKMDVNIFTTSSKYDFWVFNTLYAKFRGTASARQGLDGKPEIAAVHPLWCLANHSCDPNVAWDWRGSIKFTVRAERVLWKGKEEGNCPGLRADEEVFSHYTDVDLPVKKRREWAVGALGGNCMCERCQWEEKQ